MKTHDHEIVEERFEMNVNVSCHENKIYPSYISKKSNSQVLNVLLISGEGKSHYVFIKDFDRSIYSKAKTKNQYKKLFCIVCLQILLLKKYFLIIKSNVYQSMDVKQLIMNQE